jgi:hypothetical protein
MFTEEYMGDDAYDTSDSTSEMSSSVDTIMREQLKVIKMYKKSDPDYYSYKILMDEKIKKIESYSTPCCKNAFIRHAITGSKCPQRAGSRYEDMYFRVIDTAYQNEDSYGQRKLYFYSPEEAERHLNISIPIQIKEDWLLQSMLSSRSYNR